MFISILRNGINDNDILIDTTSLPYLWENDYVVCCNVLGLQDEFAERLYDMDPNIRGHQLDQYWINVLMKEKVNKLNYGWTREHLENDFFILGFNKEKAKYLSEALHGHPFKDHQTILQWAERYINDLFTYKVGNFKEFPHPNGEVDSEYPIRCEIAEDSRPNNCPMFIRAIDLEKDNYQHSKHLKQCLQLEPNEDEAKRKCNLYL